MAKIAPAEAALEGMRIVREHPSVILVWGLLQLVVSFAASFFMVRGGFAEANARLQELALQSNPAINPEPDPQAAQAMLSEMLGLYGQMFSALLPALGLSLLVYALLLPAVYRMVLRPEDSSPGYIRVGADEFRQLVVGLTVGLILFGAYIAAAIVLGVLLGISAIAGPVVVAILALPAILGLIALMIFLVVKFSLAGAQTFAERRIRIFGSWGLTKGRFWPILGTYLIAFVLVIVVALLGTVVALVPVGVLNGMEGVSAIFSGGAQTMEALLSPGMVGYLVIVAFISALTMAITYAPAAAIYRDIVGRPEANTFT